MKPQRQLTEVEERIVATLLEKSQEAFLLAIELYNRPTIKYHVEGCSFFLCNAWELMLKAYLIKRDGESSIRYKDNPERTIALEECVRKVFTNENDPLRVNMALMANLRNTSTHYFVAETEFLYGPVLQSCVTNYDDKLKELHDIEISDLIPQDYLRLTVRRGHIDIEQARARYTPDVIQKMIDMQSEVLASIDDVGNARIASYYKTELRMTKKADADLTFRVDPSAQGSVAVIRSLTEPLDKFSLRQKDIIGMVNKRLARDGVEVSYPNGVKKFNQYHFSLFQGFYHLKSDARYSYNTSLAGEQARYSYSQQVVDLIVEMLERDPVGAIQRLKEEVGKS